jgi:lipoyl(octanoyl) transferase
MRIQDLGTIPYRDAWALQEQLHAQVLEGAEEKILLLEHPPVITMGRRPGLSKNILAASNALQKLGVETVESDRGGDVTFHGPGQLIAYPIIRLADHKLSVGSYVRALQQIVIETLNQLGVPSRTDTAGIGVWTCSDECDLAKVCAFGVRVRRGVTMHGLALNVTTDLSYFNLIIPCGIPDRPVTSLQKILGDACPPMERVKHALADSFMGTFAAPSPQAASQRLD